MEGMLAITSAAIVATNKVLRRKYGDSVSDGL